MRKDCKTISHRTQDSIHHTPHMIHFRLCNEDRIQSFTPCALHMDMPSKRLTYDLCFPRFKQEMLETNLMALQMCLNDLIG
ncbi:hypothetical protein RRG08_025151 [Elysia crispata]|uniref:Uncharacterized protein n=1 Tax=Elysia crispata TaxID=231223 RepID=A0AAE0YAQ7_9GAST|nr:hypothetical protein RRG08_025151 [Elysia crispata]